MAGYPPEPRRSAPPANDHYPRTRSRGGRYQDDPHRDDAYADEAHRVSPRGRDAYPDGPSRTGSRGREAHRDGSYRSGSRGRNDLSDGLYRPRSRERDDLSDGLYRPRPREREAYPGYRQGADGHDGYLDGLYRDSRHRDPFRPDARRPVRAGGPGSRGHAMARRRDTTGGAEGNERLTALTGAVLLVLFAAEGLTILAIRQLLTLHFFLGMLLVGPVALKASSTVYRFARYYSGSPEYRRKGPPSPLLRLLGPFVLITSASVIGTGIMLAVDGPSAGTWLFLHKAAFVLWFGVMTIHVLAYVWRLPRHISSDFANGMGRRAGEVLAGRRARWLLLTAAVLTGLLLALMTYHRADLWTRFLGG